MTDYTPVRIALNTWARYNRGGLPDGSGVFWPDIDDGHRYAEQLKAARLGRPKLFQCITCNVITNTLKVDNLPGVCPDWNAQNPRCHLKQIRQPVPCKHSRGTITNLGLEWPSEVDRVDQAILKMYRKHDSVYSDKLKIVIYTEYLSRVRDESKENRASHAAMPERTYYHRLEHVHRWLSNELAFDVALKTG